MIFLPFFDSQASFLDPQKTKEGEPYAPHRYKQIVKECYLISKNCNTSYTDLMEVTPSERKYLLEFITEEIKRSQEAMEQAQQQAKVKK